MIRHFSNKSYNINTEKYSHIYIILNTINGKYYIGSSVNYRSRWSAHIHLLKNNKHFNRHLQHAYNKYDANNFEFSLLCSVVNSDNIKDIEENILKFHFENNREKLYNMNSKVIDSLSSGNIKGSLNPKAKLNENKVSRIRDEFNKINNMKIGKRYELLGEKYGVSPLTISRIIRNKLWRK